MKASEQEPAERLHEVKLSTAELLAVIKYHVQSARKIPGRLGKAALELQAESPFGCGRSLKALHQTAQGQIEARLARANELIALLPKEAK